MFACAIASLALSALLRKLIRIFARLLGVVWPRSPRPRIFGCFLRTSLRLVKQIPGRQLLTVSVTVSSLEASSALPGIVGCVGSGFGVIFAFCGSGKGSAAIVPLSLRTQPPFRRLS